MKELSKTYNPKEVEDKIYERWERSGFFNPDNLGGEPFSIMMPPPNVTGELHTGHATYTIQDLMIRHARMEGKKTLWLPGTDHAAIATNYVVERKIWEEEKKTRHDLGREEFLRRVNEFVEKTKGKIQIQLKKMGFSCDWSREKYTLSPELSLAVRTVFKQMHEAGLIYRGNRIVNWCPRCATTLADDEALYKEVKDKLYFIRYPVAAGKEALVVATVRPETMLADTAVAIHPDDKRYKKYIGKKVMLPLVNRELPVIADSYVDQIFGSGVIKVTPGHDAHDFEIGERHKLEIINLFTPDGKINEEEALNHGFEKYAGLTVAQGREKVVADLGDAGFIEKTKDYVHNVATCYRCGTVIEPIVSRQWFVDVNKKFRKDQSLKDMAREAVASGKIQIVPERFTKTYLEWMDNLRDWNISRQIWFGHQIPVWHKGDEVYVGVEEPQEEGWVQDPDTLDTWFSSSLWTFSTLGWPASVETSAGKPKPTGDLALYHPTTILETGYDILFFWVARMIIMTGFALQDIPFKTVYLHGLVRDRGGRKMSKSLRNVIDPLDMIEQYGTDALRLSLVIGTTPGNDLKLSAEKIAGFRNFANKLWNIARYILSQSDLSLNPSPSPGEGKIKRPLSPGDGERMGERSPAPQTLADEWILAELDNLIATVNQHLANYQYGLAGEELEKFTWNKFADWYLEISKIKNQKSNSKEVLPYVLSILLKLWHPFIPFVTEHIWGKMADELLMIQKYPLPSPKAGGGGKGEGKKFPLLQNLITGLRNLRAEYKEAPSKILAAYLELPKELQWIRGQIEIIEKLARVKLNFEPLPQDKKMPYFLWEKTKVYLIISGFDPKKEKQIAEKELKEVEARVKALDAQLAKKDFLEKAPAEVVEKIKADFEAIKQREEKLREKIKTLK